MSEEETDKRKGNRFWEARSSHGRKPIFDNGEDLWDACVEYFEWVDSNPLYEGKLTTYQGKSCVEEVPKMRAMTLKALCIFLDISFRSWLDWKNDRDDLKNTITQVEQIIFTQKFEGAAADLLNSAIIIRQLGLVDKKQSAHTGPNGEPLSIGDMKGKSLDGMTKGEFKEAMKEIYGNDEQNIPDFESVVPEGEDNSEDDAGEDS